MDEFEERVRESMRTSVDDWEPTPSEVRRTGTPVAGRGRGVLVAAVVVLVAGGGIGTAIGLSGGSHQPRAATLASGSAPASASPSPVCPGLQFLSESAYAALASAPPGGCAATPASDCPSSTPGTAATPGGGYHPLTDIGSAYSSTLCLTADSPGPTGPSAATQPASSAVSTSSGSQLPRQCTRSQLPLSLTTNQASYEQTQPININTSALSTATCEAAEPEVSISPTGSDRVSWETCHGLAPSLTERVCNSSLGVYFLKPAEKHAAHYTWDQRLSAATSNKVAVFLAPGSYTVTYSWGSISTNRVITVTAPRTCTSEQLALHFTSDKIDYARGEVAHLTGSISNSSDQLCSATPYFSVPTASDASGVAIWTCNDPSGLPRNAGCNVATPFFSAQPLSPGAQLAQPAGTTQQTWSWNLVHDGTKDTDPGPVPDGSYTLNWTGLQGTRPAPATILVTVTG